MNSSVCNQRIMWQIKVFATQSCLKNKTALLLDLKVQIAVKENGWNEFLHQSGRERYYRENQVMLPTYSSSSTLGTWDLS
jgi:hypothetical protein